MSRPILTTLSALLAVAALTGCGEHYKALSTPPPFTKAELCDGEESCGGSETIELTRGIAFAFECIGDHGRPCANAKITVKDAAIATVFDGYLDTLSASGYRSSGAAPRSAFVVVGKAVGETSLTVSSDDGTTDFTLTIDAP